MKVTDAKRNQADIAQKTVDDLKNKQYTYPIGSNEAMIRGIRSLGYKSNAKSTGEHIDNACQSGATNIDIRLLCLNEGKNKKNVSHIVIADDGCGMHPEIIRFMMCIGGTTRENDRDGYGRFGYGAPASALSLGKKWEVYSKHVDGGTINHCLFDVNKMKDYLDKEGNVCVPNTKSIKSMPAHLQDIDLSAGGTVVVISDLDKLQYKTHEHLTDLLRVELSTMYYQAINEINISLDGVALESVDPIFDPLSTGDNGPKVITPGPMVMKIKKPDGSGESNITLRVSRLPYGSLGRDYKGDANKANPRYKTVKSFPGIVFSRKNRVIDSHSEHNQLSNLGIGKWNNYDQYVRVEINFLPDLDEYFNINTAKQHVRVEKSIADQIAANKDFQKTLISFRNEAEADVQAKRTAKRNEDRAEEKKKISEVLSDAMDTVSLDSNKKSKQERLGNEEIEIAAEAIAKETQRTVEEEAKQLKELSKGVKVEVLHVSSQGAEPYWCKPWGSTTRLFINTDHIMIQKVYLSSDARTQDKLEILFFAYAYHDMIASEKVAELYESEKPKWFSIMSFGIKRLMNSYGSEAKEDSVLQLIEK